MTLDITKSHLKNFSEHFLGFPGNMTRGYDEDMTQFVNTWFNNCGDPFGKDSYAGTPTMKMEKEVCLYFADLLHLERDQAWGYIGSSSSEAILVGLLAARDKMKAIKQNSLEYLNEPLAFYSTQVHYTVPNNCHILQIKSYFEEGNASQLPCPLELQDSKGNWSSGIPIKADGSIDEQKFKKAIEFFAERNHPIIVVLVFGSTIGHAIDNV